jgi:hypothetical protein
MFARGFGGLEKLFLDEIEMLSAAGMRARGLVRRGSGGGAILPTRRGA